MDKGVHKITLCAYGNRINTFGALHNTDFLYRWAGPPFWRTKDNKWAYEYQLTPCGILTAPRILTKK